MVNTLHENQFKLVLDVVYNHTSEGFFGDGINSFNGFVPYYYYRISHFGYVSNGSGCGNEFRSESPMGRKFIIDSLKYWTRFYNFDGYRFDLMGLIDLETIMLLMTELKKIKPDVLIYGEPWTAGTTPINPTYKGAQKNKGFLVFNDEFRDALKGGVFHKKDKGFIQSKGTYHYDKIIQGILGSINTFSSSPVESINYFEIHDNNTLFDKLYFSINDTENFLHPTGQNLIQIKQMHCLAAFILLTSQGIPVLHLGQDFMRTKSGVENSYNSGDTINAIDWNRKKEFYDVFVYYQNLIRLRKEHPVFRINNSEELRKRIEFRYDVFSLEKRNGLSYILEGNGKISKYLIMINPYDETVNVHLPEGQWKLLFHSGIYHPDIDAVQLPFQLNPLSGTILCRS
jgi:pullulanase